MVTICLIAFGLRAWNLETPSFDYDETYEILHAEPRLDVLVDRKDGFPPLYRWITGNLFELTKNDQIFRWFSAAVGTATIFIVGLLGRYLVDAKAGLMAALLITTSAYHLQISQLGRGYSLYILFAACYLYFAFQIRRDGSWFNWIGLIGCAWLSVATHYYAGLLLVLGGLMLLIELKGVALKRALISALTLTVVCMPLLVCLKADMAESDEFFHKVGFDAEAYAFTYLLLVTGKTFGPSLTELRELGASAGLKAMLPWAIIAFIPILVLSMSAWKQLRLGDRTWLLILMLIPPPLVVLAAQYSPTGYSYRYMAWMIVPLMLVLGAGAALDRKRPLVTTSTLLLIAIGIFAMWNRHHNPRYAEQDFHKVVERIQLEEKDNRAPTVIATPHYFGAAALYALPESWNGITLSANPHLDEQDWETKLPPFLEEINQDADYWIIAPWYPEDYPRRAVRDELVEKLDGEFVERVTPTLMLYRAEHTTLP